MYSVTDTATATATATVTSTAIVTAIVIYTNTVTVTATANATTTSCKVLFVLSDLTTPCYPYTYPQNHCYPGTLHAYDVIHRYVCSYKHTFQAFILNQYTLI